MKFFKKILLLLFLLNCISQNNQAAWLGKYLKNGYALGSITSLISIQLWLQNQSFKQELQEARFNAEKIELENSRRHNEFLESKVDQSKKEANKDSLAILQKQSLSIFKNIVLNQIDLNNRIQRFKTKDENQQQSGSSNSVMKSKESHSNDIQNQSNAKVLSVELLKIENKRLKEELNTVTKANQDLQQIIEASIARQREALVKD